MANGSKEGPEHPHELNGSPATPLPSPQQQEIDEFWRKTLEDIENTANLNNHALPLTSVAKIIRDNQGSLMMSSDTPPFLTKLLEILVQELIVRASMFAISHDRSTILESDIYEAINSRESYVFLSDVLPMYGTNPDQTSMSNNVPQLQQVHMGSQFLATTSTLIENGPTDPLYKLGEQSFQFPKDTLVSTTNTQPDPLELKNDEDLNNESTTSSGSIDKTK
ncbi:hypothetical protein BAE44_0001642 [Dichanthelium oligosanthes]|uniref:Core Histone H2A/H2B/H3 domain-containing protein n=1 Tax=Dichanthelium oligosanthes TaxID=888268 RepID=A0A1E5WJM4_9POAL|nr:hypothetical protein BAE44_0001642 [Dichanthelium oligosanthes]